MNDGLIKQIIEDIEQYTKDSPEVDRQVFLSELQMYLNDAESKYNSDGSEKNLKDKAEATFESIKESISNGSSLAKDKAEDFAKDLKLFISGKMNKAKGEIQERQAKE